MPLLPSELQGRSRRPTRGAGGGAGRRSRKDTRRVVRLVLANLALVALLYWMLFARGGSTSASSKAPARHRYSNGWMSRKEMLDRQRPPGAMDLAESAWNTAQEDIRAMRESLRHAGQNLHRVRKARHLGDDDDEEGTWDSQGNLRVRGARAGKRGARRGGSGASSLGEVTEPWLVVGVPTAPRAGDADYLTETLETLLDELPDDERHPLFRRVLVVVMNAKPGRHEVFDRVRARFGSSGSSSGSSGSSSGSSDDEFAAKAKTYVRFMDSPGTYGDPTPNKPDPDDLHNPGNIPGHAVRQQTADLATLIDAAAAESGPGATAPYFMFMEDDFRTCAGTMKALTYLVEKADAVYPQWLGVRFSYGMNGVVMRRKDLPPFAEYLATHVSRQPPDILWREWVEGRREDVRSHTLGRKVLVYKWNLMEHVGEVSTFAVRPNRPKWPRCYDQMKEVWSLSTAEKFDGLRCDDVDVSPCVKRLRVNMEDWRGATPSFPWTRQ